MSVVVADPTKLAPAKTPTASTGAAPAGTSQYGALSGAGAAGGPSVPSATKVADAVVQLREALQSGGNLTDPALLAKTNATSLLTDRNVTDAHKQAFLDNPSAYTGPTSGETKSIADLLNDLATFNPVELENLQIQLIQAGYAPKGLDIGNKFDSKTRAAYGALLADGIAYPDTPLNELMQQRAAAASTSGKGTVSGGNVYVTKLTDPNTIHSVADKVAQSLLGRDATDAEKAKYVSLIHNDETSAQAGTHAAAETADKAKTAANTSANNGGGPDFESFVNGIIKTESGDPKSAGQSTQYGQVTGKYQILDSTWGGFKGYAQAKDAPEAVQDEFARARLKAYYDNYGAAGAAVAWYGGGGLAAKYVADPSNPQWNNAQPGGPSVNGYIQRMLTNSGSTTPLTNAATGDTYIPPTNISETGVDPQADLQAQIRKDNPLEAGAHDVGNQWQAFSQIIGLPARVA